MSRIQFSQFQEAFELGLTKTHKDRLRRHPKEYLGWMREEPVKRWVDYEWGVTGLGVAQEKGIGETFQVDQIFKAPKKSYRLKAWGLALLIQYEALTWDIVGAFKGLMNELAKSHIDRMNLVAYELLMSGFDSTADSKYLDKQGEALFSDSHKRLDGGSWDNKLTTGLSHLGLQEARTLLRQQLDERGRYAMIQARNLIVSIAKEWQAETITMTDKLPGTADNDINTLKKQKYRILSSVYHSVPEYWYLTGDKSQMKWKLRTGKKPDLEFDTEPRTRDRWGSSYSSFDVANWDAKGAVASDGGT